MLDAYARVTLLEQRAELISSAPQGQLFRPLFHYPKRDGRASLPAGAKLGPLSLFAGVSALPPSPRLLVLRSSQLHLLHCFSLQSLYTIALFYF